MLAFARARSDEPFQLSKCAFWWCGTLPKHQMMFNEETLRHVQNLSRNEIGYVIGNFCIILSIRTDSHSSLIIGVAATSMTLFVPIQGPFIQYFDIIPKRRLDMVRFPSASTKMIKVTRSKPKQFTRHSYI